MHRRPTPVWLHYRIRRHRQCQMLALHLTRDYQQMTDRCLRLSQQRIAGHRLHRWLLLQLMRQAIR